MGTAWRRGAPASREPRKKGTSDLVPRILVAIPAIAFAVVIIWQGEWVFAAGIGALAVVCVHELSVMFERARPVRLAAMIAVVGLVVAGTLGDERQVLLALVASLPLTFVLAVAMPQRERVTGVDLGDDADDRLDRARRRARGDAARARPRRRAGGDGPARNVLRRHVRVLRRAAARPPQAGAGDLAQQDLGRARSAGSSSGRWVVWYWSRTYDGDWISGTDGLLLGLAVVIAAPIGDLFESLIKRDMGTKDTGTLFGAHGGALDRVDAALFALVAGYYVWLAVA